MAEEEEEKNPFSDFIKMVEEEKNPDSPPGYYDVSDVWRTGDFYEFFDCIRHASTFIVPSLRALDLNLREFSTCLQTQPTKRAFLPSRPTRVCDSYGLELDRRLLATNDLCVEATCNEQRECYLTVAGGTVFESIRDYLVEIRGDWTKICSYWDALKLATCTRAEDKEETKKYLFNFAVSIQSENCTEPSETKAFLNELMKDYKHRLFAMCDAVSAEYILSSAKREGIDVFEILADPTPSKENPDNTDYTIIDGDLDPELVFVLAEYNCPFDLLYFGNEAFFTLLQINEIPPEICKSFRPKPRNKLRKILGMQIVNFYWIGKLNMIDRSAALQCLRYIWNSIPDEYFTQDELEKYMWEKCPEESFEDPNYLDMVVEVCRFYDKVALEGDRNVRGPRTLQHKCRLAIRKEMIILGTIQNGGGHELSTLLPKDVFHYVKHLGY